MKILLPLLLLPLLLTAQAPHPIGDTDNESVYRVNPLASGAVGLGGMIVGTVGIDRLRRKDRITPLELASLNPDDVPGIDRWALNLDEERIEGAEASSDLFFNGAILLPFTLFLDKKFRKDWLDITVMYLEAHALNANFYAWSPIGPTLSDRIRPVAYYDGIDEGFRSLGNTRNSFFSGHVSTTAIGTFFTAKVLSDYNPQWSGGQRALVFTAASLPPVFVAVQRVRSLKHFPTDTAVGLAVGAFFGIMTPQIHKNWQRKHRTRLSVSGSYANGAAAGGLVLSF